MASRFVLPFANVGSGISPSDGAKLFFFESGTSTDKDTFSDEALTTKNANPVIANGNGVFPDIFLPDGGRYKVVLKDKNNVTESPEADPIVGGVSATLSSKSLRTVAAMVASTELNIGDIVETAGYLTKGDGGDNRYEIVAAATGTDDGGSFIDLTGITGQAKGLFPTGSITIKQFGADGDSPTTDDFIPVQAVFSYANSVEDIEVDGLGLTYKLGTHTDLKGKFILKNTKIFLPKDIDLTGAPNFGGTTRALSARNTTDIVFDNVEIFSEKIGLTQLVSIAIENTTRIKMSKCTFRDFGDITFQAQGIIIFNSSDINITASVFSNNAGDGGAIAESSSNIVVSGNTCSGNGDWGFAFSNNCSSGVVSDNLFLNNTSTGTGVDECVDFTFTGNVSIGNEHGVRVARFGVTTDPQRDIVISGNDLRSNGQGIEVTGSKGTAQIIISGNSIRSSTTQGIQIADSQGFTINGNLVQGSGNEGIRIISFVDPAGDGTIVGNFIDGADFGIRHIASGGSLTDILVVGNKVNNATVVKYSIPGSHVIADETDDFRFSKAYGVPSALTSLTATAGGVVSPGNFQGFVDFYVDGVKRKIPFFNV